MNALAKWFFAISLIVSLQPVSVEAKSLSGKEPPVKTNVEAQDPKDAMVEFLATREVAKAKLLHKQGVSYDAVSPADDLTGLMRAADEGDEENVNAILALGANINAKNKNNESALWYAVYSGHEKLALDLLKKGASPSETRPDTKECLAHMTAQSGLKKISAKLAKLTPKCLSQKDADGRTPAEVAKSLGYTKIAKILTPSQNSKKSSHVH